MTQEMAIWLRAICMIINKQEEIMGRFKEIFLEAAPPYERGVQYGQQAKEEIEVCINTYKDYFKATGRLTWETAAEHVQGFVDLLRKDYREFLDEIRGIADGSEQSFEDIMVLNIRYELLHFPTDGECTAYALKKEATADGHVYVGQNWDNRPFFLKHTLLIHEEDENGTKILGMTEAGQLIRNGMNSHGLGMCCNSLNSIYDSAGIGIPANFLRRKLLSLSTLDEMIAWLVNAPRTVSNNYCLASAENRAVDVEAVPKSPMLLLPEDNILTHANHIVADRNVDAYKGMKFRGELLYKLLAKKNGVITTDYIKECLKNHENYPDSLCAHMLEGETDLKKMWQTNASIIYDLTTLELDICWGPPCEGEYVRYQL